MMPYSRKKKTRNIEKKILIYCEGSRNRSEYVYFERYIKRYCSFNGNLVDIIIRDTRFNTAVFNAERLRKAQLRGYPDKKIYEINPWTDVDLLIKDIKKLEADYPK